jgi:hypothetical protein
VVVFRDQSAIPSYRGLKASWKTQILQVVPFCSGRELIISNCDVVRKHKPLALDSAHAKSGPE